jgi:hypothetical protein
MIYASGAAGPPGYGGVSEDSVGEQESPGRQVPGYEGGPENKSELGNPPSELDLPPNPDDIAGQQPIGVPVDLTE